MESKLIDSLTEAQITKEMEPQVGRMSNARSLKNMGLIYELTSNPAEVSKEAISIRRIPVEDFPISTMHDHMNVLIDYLDSCQVDALNRASELPRKRNNSKKHSDGTAKKANTSSFARRLLDTSIEEPKTTGATSSAGTVLSKFIPFETHCQSVDNS